MTATGIVRRIDELGRIVIPKEIRKSLHIREGDPLEIIVGDGEVAFRKYSPLENLAGFAKEVASELSAAIGRPVAVSDGERVIAAAGAGKREAEGKPLSENMKTLFIARGNYFVGQGGPPPELYEGCPHTVAAVLPVISDSSAIGIMAVASVDGVSPLSDADRRLLMLSASLLGKRAE